MRINPLSLEVRLEHMTLSAQVYAMCTRCLPCVLQLLTASGGLLGAMAALCAESAKSAGMDPVKHDSLQSFLVLLVLRSYFSPTLQVFVK